MIRYLGVLVILVVSCGRLADAQADSPSVAPSPQWGGCDLPGGSTKVKIGDPTPICLTVGPGGSWSAGVPYIRWMLQPKADDYSRFRIPNSYNDLVFEQKTELKENMTIHTASQDQLSWLRVYYDQDNNRVFPFLTAIIDVKDGIVQGIAWDDACVFCSSGRCLENTYDFDGNSADERQSGAPSKGCYFNTQQCDVIESDSDVTCDVQMYVVWTGTDSEGIAMQSSANRFSNFSPSKLQDRARNALPDIPGIF